MSIFLIIGLILWSLFSAKIATMACGVLKFNFWYIFVWLVVFLIWPVFAGSIIVLLLAE